MHPPPTLTVLPSRPALRVGTYNTFTFGVTGCFSVLLFQRRAMNGNYVELTRLIIRCLFLNEIVFVMCVHVFYVASYRNSTPVFDIFEFLISLSFLYIFLCRRHHLHKLARRQRPPKCFKITPSLVYPRRI